MNENQSQTEFLLDIVRAVKSQTLLLPEFQRDFRWELDQTYDLFDSLIRKIFIGTVIYGKPSFEMTLREIDDRPRKGPGSRAKLRIQSYSKEDLVNKSRTQNLRIVLDGQQRITSMRAARFRSSSYTSGSNSAAARRSPRVAASSSWVTCDMRTIVPERSTGRAGADAR